jgi:hypothetical protein
MATNRHPAERRELHVDAAVAQRLTAAQIAQLDAVVEDPDSRCCACDLLITGPAAELVVFIDGESALAQLAHPSCMRSDVYIHPGLARGMDRALADSREGSDVATLLGLRPTKPHALLFLEPTLLFAGIDEDPLEAYVRARGFLPVSGEIEQLAPPVADSLTLSRTLTGLALTTPLSSDLIQARAAELESWWRAAEGEALVIVARGLGLKREPPVIAEALRLRPAWGAIATLSHSPPPSPLASCARLVARLRSRIARPGSSLPPGFNPPGGED